MIANLYEKSGRFDSTDRRRFSDDSGPGSRRTGPEGTRGGRKPPNAGDAPATRGSYNGRRGAGAEPVINKDVAIATKVQEMLKAKRALIEVRPDQHTSTSLLH